MTQKDTKRSNQYNALNDNNDCILHIRLNTVHRNRWIFRVKRFVFCRQYFEKFSRVADGFHSVFYLRLVSVSMDCVLVLVITFYYGLRSDPNLERIQPIDGPNVSRGKRDGKRPPRPGLSANNRMKALMELKKLD
jgi:hypothetical protein